MLTPGQISLRITGYSPLCAPQLGALKGSLREDRFDAMKAQGLLPLGLIPELVLEPPKAMDLCQATRPVGLDNGWLF